MFAATEKNSSILNEVTYMFKLTRVFVQLLACCVARSCRPFRVSEPDVVLCLMMLKLRVSQVSSQW